MNNITFTFPNWFLTLFSMAFIGFVAYCGGLHSHIKTMCADYPKIQRALTRISEILPQKNLAKEFVYTESPVKLTPLGIEALKEAKFDEFYNANKNTLLARIRKTEPKTLADLENTCKSIMLNIEDTLPNFEPIKQYAYSKGEPISNILFAIAIKLRDLAAEELNIKPTQVEEKPE